MDVQNSQDDPEYQFNAFGKFVVYSMTFAAYGIAVALISLVICYLTCWSYVDWRFQAYFPGAFQSPLDKVTVMHVTKGEDFQQFKENGGLKINNHWRGYSVNEVLPMFGDKNGALDGLSMSISVDGSYMAKDGTIRNLKESLSDLCGSDWKLSEGVYRIDDGKTICMLENSEDGNEVKVGVIVN